MESKQKNQAVLTSSALLSLFGASSGLPNPDDSNPIGPWGPVMRRAGERVAAVPLDHLQNLGGPRLIHGAPLMQRRWHKRLLTA